MSAAIPGTFGMLTLQRGMEHEASKADQEIAKICNLEDCIMTLLSAALDSSVGQIDEHEICEGIDDLGGVVCCIIVLLLSAQKLHALQAATRTSSHHWRVEVTGSQ